MARSASCEKRIMQDVAFSPSALGRSETNRNEELPSTASLVKPPEALCSWKAGTIITSKNRVAHYSFHRSPLPLRTTWGASLWDSSRNPHALRLAPCFVLAAACQSYITKPSIYHKVSSKICRTCHRTVDEANQSGANAVWLHCYECDRNYCDAARCNDITVYLLLL